MGFFSRRAQSSRNYPTAPARITGDKGRFFRSKTSGARRAGTDAEKWERADRARDRRGGTRDTNWNQ